VGKITHSLAQGDRNQMAISCADKINMKTNTSTFARFALLALCFFCLGASVMADTAPMYIRIKGKMMRLTPLTEDVKLKNGCTVCVRGVVIDPKGKKTVIKEGQTVSPEGAIQEWINRPKL
jgi:hypothetical protein